MRLGDVVVGADLEPDHLVGLGRARGEHHDRHARRRFCRADATTHLEPAKSRQHQVEDHRRRTLALDERKAELAVGRLEDLESFRLEIHAHQLADVALVLDDQQLATLGGRRCRSVRARVAHRRSHTRRQMVAGTERCRMLFPFTMKITISAMLVA
jgi:hypothetical protein